MKLYAHVGPDGSIEGLVAGPEGEHFAGIVPSPGTQVCEIQNHGLKGDSAELDQLAKLLDTHAVAVTPAYGKLVHREKK